MSELRIDWEEYKEKFQLGTIEPKIDINKGHALLKKFGPGSWKYTIKLLTWMTLLAIPVAIILFFYVKWWIPVIIIILSFMFMKGIREESAKAIIKISLENPAFYSHAVISGTMRVFTKK
jgi:hypothetical protein